MPNEIIVPPTEGSSIRSNVEPSDSNWANKYEDFDIGKPIGNILYTNGHNNLHISLLKRGV
jgi:hypothetical protein